MRIPFTADAEVHSALGRLGRTEDVQFSPSGRRLALAGYVTNRVLVLDVAADPGAEPARVEVSGAFAIGSSSIDHPHGLAWLDERTLVVANRYATVAIFELPDGRPASGEVTLDAVRTIGEDSRDLIRYPGSVSALPIGLGLAELLVCNNHVHHVSRHLVDRRDGHAVRASESLISAGLQLPDGVAHSRSGEWIAVSNHDRNCTFLYRYDDRLHDGSPPDGVLHGVRSPHGLLFTRDERWILLADADAPLVHAYYSPDADWTGERLPATSIQNLSDDTYKKGNYLAGEGGPKGIDLTPHGALLVATCDEDRLVFFDVRPAIGTVASEIDRPDAAGEAASARAFLMRNLGAARSRVDEATTAVRRSCDRDLQLLMSSRWWRLTGPLRRLSAFGFQTGHRVRHRLRRMV
jgi:hypothetical protein